MTLADSPCHANYLRIRSGLSGDDLAEFDRAVSLHQFAASVCAVIFGKEALAQKAQTTPPENASPESESTEATCLAGAIAEAYRANLFELKDLLNRRYGRFFSWEETVERWRQLYRRLVETGVRPPIRYEIDKVTMLLSFDQFHLGAMAAYDNVRQYRGSRVV